MFRMSTIDPENVLKKSIIGPPDGLRTSLSPQDLKKNPFHFDVLRRSFEDVILLGILIHKSLNSFFICLLPGRFGPPLFVQPRRSPSQRPFHLAGDLHCFGVSTMVQTFHFPKRILVLGPSRLSYLRLPAGGYTAI